MFTNVPAVTIWEKTVQAHTPVYARHETGAVYWEGSTGQSGGRDRVPEDGVLLCIPADSLSGYLPKPDDRILPGSIPDAAPPRDALTVMKVQDFLYAAAFMQHLEVHLS